MSIFSSVKANRPSRNVFNLSHERKFSLDFANLTPFMCVDLVPGDYFKVNTEIFMRMAPMLAPVMHRLNVYTHYFFVPNRLVMPDWEEFITGGDDGYSEASLPLYDLTESFLRNVCTLGSLSDYMGLPCKNSDDYNDGDVMRNINLMPFLAYQKIFNEYYRDENLVSPIDLDYKKDSWTENNVAAILTLRRRAWEKDYFTSALPWTQKGPIVTVPVGSQDIILDSDGTFQVVRGPGLAAGETLMTGNGYDGGQQLVSKPPVGDVGNVNIDPNGTLKTSGESSATINDLRTAFQIQRWLERSARAGSRYVENILAHFGVVSPDARLQRPEYLGGGKAPVVISEVLQTSETQVSPQGNMAGHGMSAAGQNGFKYKAKEHGYIIGIMSVMPRTAYQQGVPRHFLRSDKFEYFWPTLAHLGEQEVYNRELFEVFDPLDNSGMQPFGYQSRYSEYKYIPSSVHGDFRDTLNFWHMGRIFDSPPLLNAQFVSADPTHRIFAVEESDFDPLWCQLYNKVTAVRPMPRYGEPGYIDHF